MAGLHGHGTILSYGATNATNGTTALANIVKIGTGEYSVDTHDVSDMSSTDKFKEFIGGMIDPGSITLELNYNKSNVTTILSTSAVGIGISRGWTVAIPAGTGTTASVSFTGFLEKFTPGEMDINGAAKGSASIKISGKPTWA